MTSFPTVAINWLTADLILVYTTDLFICLVCTFSIYHRVRSIVSCNWSFGGHVWRVYCLESQRKDQLSWPSCNIVDRIIYSFRDDMLTVLSNSS